MFCPKCSDLLTEINGEAFCRQGEMYLSQSLTHRLKECFIAKVRRPQVRKWSCGIGGKWFCPGCGVAMSEIDGIISCPKCELSINEFVYELVERCEHKRENPTEN